MCVKCIEALEIAREEARRKHEVLWLHSKGYVGQHHEGGACHCQPEAIKPDDTRQSAFILAGVTHDQAEAMKVGD